MSVPPMRRTFWPIAGTICLFLILSPAATVFSSSYGIMERIKTFQDKQAPADQVEPHIPVPVNAIEVKARYQGGRFYTETRKDRITRFKCSGCHTNEPVKIRDAAAMSHADIQVDHGEKGTPLSCNTCHNPDKRDYLQTHKDDKIDMNHVYNLCGECHFRQKKDWIGGAHGKRISHWAGERVVKNCTSCHNPHTPLFKKRWPKIYSVPLQ